MHKLIKLVRNPFAWYLALVIALMGVIGHMDFEDETRYHKLYCSMAAEGYTPDYKGIYDEECVPLGYPEELRPYTP